MKKYTVFACNGNKIARYGKIFLTSMMPADIRGEFVGSSDSYDEAVAIKRSCHRNPITSK